MAKPDWITITPASGSNNGSQFMISCGNGFPTVPISNRIIAMFKNSVGTHIVNFDFYTV